MVEEKVNIVDFLRSLLRNLVLRTQSTGFRDDMPEARLNARDTKKKVMLLDHFEKIRRAAFSDPLHILGLQPYPGVAYCT